MLLRRLLALVFLCVTLVIVWMFISPLFFAGGEGAMQPGSAALSMRQTVHDEQIALTYTLKMADTPDQPPQIIQVAIPNRLLKSADRVNQTLNSRMLGEQLRPAVMQLESLMFDERQRRLLEVENTINTSLGKKNAQVSLHISSNNILSTIDWSNASSNTSSYNTKTAKNLDRQQQAIVDWIHQSVDQYKNYVMNLSADQNWMNPRLREINKLLPQHLYSIENGAATNLTLLPNYALISQRAQSALYPLARALYDNAPVKDPRGLADFTLKFIQAMPTRALRARELGRSDTVSFSMPVDCIFDNQCDPDAKVTLMASLLSVLIPQTPIIMGQLNSGAFIGIAIAPQPDDAIHTLQGVGFIMADPSSRQLMPFGQLGPKYQNAALDNAFGRVLLLNTF